MQSLADRLTMVAERSGLSYRELAVKVGLSFGYVSRLHSGEKDSPTLDVLVALAHVYRTSPAFLRDGDPAVDVWSSLTRDPQFQVAGTRDPAFRVNLILSHAADRFPGHLRTSDVPHWIGRQLEPVDDDLLVRIAKLSGVPIGWLRLGHYAFIPQEILGDWPDLMEFLEEYAQKKAGAH